MAQHREKNVLCCPICLDMMKEPVTIPCGHNYCLKCISNYWDEEEAHSCPQCRQIFTPRPSLVTNKLLAELVEKKKKKNAQPATATEEACVEPIDIPCDFCSEKMVKAVKSCLQCLVSFCDLHLQPHFDLDGLKQHKLIPPSKKLLENICPSHNEVMKIFCRTDLICICYLCSVDEHRGHDTVTVAAHVINKQKQLETDQKMIQKKIQERTNDIEVLKQQMKTIDQSADDAIRRCHEILSEVIQQIRSRQKNEVTHMCTLQEKLEGEITMLKKRQVDLEEVSHTEDHIQFLNAYNFLLTHGAANPDFIDIHPLTFNEDVMADVFEAKKKLQNTLNKEFTIAPATGPDGEGAVTKKEPMTREDCFKLACPFTVDLSTANIFIKHCGGLQVQCSEKECSRPNPDRFTDWCQVLCRQRLTGRCYWEVWLTDSFCCNGEEEGVIAVAYKSMSRSGPGSAFGYNEMSWALHCFSGGYEFRHNSIATPINGPQTFKIGVYLDYEEGVLSFYSIDCETMTLLHKVQCKFTLPLHAGVSIYRHGQTAEFVCGLCEPSFVEGLSDKSSE